MIGNMNGEDMFVLISVLAVGSIAIGWVTEGVLSDLAFGIFGNATLAFGGSSAAIYLLDHALTKRWVPLVLLSEPVVLWIVAACLGALTMILGPLLLRSLTIR